METTYKMEVIDDNILNFRKPNRNLYMVVWQRLANSGIHYVWAKDEHEALVIAGYSPEFVLHTVVKISPLDMPVCAGVQK